MRHSKYSFRLLAARLTVFLPLAALGAGPIWAQPTTEPPLVVKGTLVDERGVPAAGAEVLLRPYPNDHEQQLFLLGVAEALPDSVDAVRSGLDGTFELTAPAVGPHRLELRPRLLAEDSGATVPAVYHALLPLATPVVLAPIEVPDLHPLTVAVANEKGQPVEAALVIATPQNSQPMIDNDLGARDLPPPLLHPTFEPAAARTGSDGMARFHMPGQRTRVLVSAPGFALAERRARPGKATFRLEPHPGLVLHALDPAGEPAPGAVVRTGDDRGTPLALTDDSGSATLGVAKRRTATFDLETPEPAVGRTTPIRGSSLADASTERVVTVRLVAPDRVRGQAVDAATGRPIPNAAVWAEGEPGRRTATDRSGNFDLNVPPGRDRQRLRLAAAGYAPTRVTASAVSPDDSSRLSIGLVAAAPLFGWVLDDAGEPVAGADVLAETGGWPPSIRAASGFDGGFWIPAASYDVPYRLHVSAPGFARVTTDVPPMLPGSAGEPRHIVLAKGRPGRGRVVDTANRPIPDATVQLQVPRTINETGWSDHHGFETATTNIRGDFVFHAVGVGRYLIRASHADHVPSPHTSVDVAATVSGADLGTLTLRPGLELHGTVRDRKGEPVAGADVVAAWWEQTAGEQTRQVMTDANGRFGFRGLGAELVELLITAENYAPRLEPEVQPGSDEPLSIELEAGGASLGGLVVDPSGTPAAGALVSAHCLETRPSRLLILAALEACTRSTTTSSAGRFLFDVLGPGRWSIDAHDPADQGMRGRVEDIELGIDEPTEVEVRLRAADRVVVTVTNPQGAPVPDALVNAAIFSPPALGSTDATGRATLFINLESATMSAVAAGHPEYADQLLLVELRPGVNEVHLELDAGWEMSGFVRSPEGFPLAMATVEVTPEDGLSDFDESEVRRQWASPARTTSDRNGWFRLTGLARGRYSVKARLSGYTEGGLAAPVEIDSRSVTRLEIRLEAVPPE